MKGRDYKKGREKSYLSHWNNSVQDFQCTQLSKHTILTIALKKMFAKETLYQSKSHGNCYNELLNTTQSRAAMSFCALQASLCTNIKICDILHCSEYEYYIVIKAKPL